MTLVFGYCQSAWGPDYSSSSLIRDLEIAQTPSMFQLLISDSHVQLCMQLAPLVKTASLLHAQYSLNHGAVAFSHVYVF